MESFYGAVKKLMEENQNRKQVKSRKLVTELEKVYTADHEINAMLDLVKQETDRIDSGSLSLHAMANNQTH